MGEFVECVKGLGEASEYLNFPVVSGNVSFYNETKDKGIKPTPTIGGVGLIKNYKDMITMGFKESGNIVLVIGKTEGSLDQSIFAREILNIKSGPPPEVNLFNEKNNGETVLNLIKKKLIKSAHDVSLGGIIVAIAKMCIKGKKGIEIKKTKQLINQFQYMFSEDQGRYILEIKKENYKNVKEILNKSSVHYDEIGTVLDNDIVFEDKTKLSVDDLELSNNNWLKKYMEK
tara:strand:- start:274 stop:963 length:690 start_codon:yes stop_codon:yes gene_type:complete